MWHSRKAGWDFDCDYIDSTSKSEEDWFPSDNEFLDLGVWHGPHASGSSLISVNTIDVHLP